MNVMHKTSGVDLSQFQFSVIYSIDTQHRPPCYETLSDLTPPDYSKHGWQCTERSSSEYAYLGNEWGRGSRHRKHVTILSFDEFCEFIDHVGIFVEKCHTMGSIGAPGCGIGCVGAVPFRDDCSSSITNCYVTPIPPMSMLPDPNQLSLQGMEIPQISFEEVEMAMWEWFDDGAYSAREKSRKTA